MGGRPLIGLVLAASLALPSAAAAAPPANDAFPGTTITGSDVTTPGTNVEATFQSGEPSHDTTYGGGRSVWYAWTAPVTGAVRLDTCTSNFVSAVGVYTGAAVNALTVVARNNGSRACGNGHAKTSFKAVSGTTYRIAVDGQGNLFGPTAQGTFSLHLQMGTAPANDDRVGATAIAGANVTPSGLNAFATLEPGDPAIDLGGGGANVWWRWTAPASGPVIADTCGSDFDTTLRVIRNSNAQVMGASDDNAQCSSSTRSLVTFDAVIGETYDLAVDGWGGATGSVNLHVQQGAPPGNDSFGGSNVLSGASASSTGTTRFATVEAGEPNHAGQSTVRSVWYAWSAPASGPVIVDTCDSDFDTVLAVYTGSAVGSAHAGRQQRGLAAVLAAEPGVLHGGRRDGLPDRRRRHGAERRRRRHRARAGERAGQRRLRERADDQRLHRDDRLEQPLRDEGGGRAGPQNDAGGGSVWFKWTATANGPVDIDTCGTDFQASSRSTPGAR